MKNLKANPLVTAVLFFAASLALSAFFWVFDLLKMNGRIHVANVPFATIFVLTSMALILIKPRKFKFFDYAFWVIVFDFLTWMFRLSIIAAFEYICYLLFEKITSWWMMSAYVAGITAVLCGVTYLIRIGKVRIMGEWLLERILDLLFLAFMSSWIISDIWENDPNADTTDKK